MGNEASSVRVDFKSLDDSTIQSLRQSFKNGPLKELPSTWNILPPQQRLNIFNQVKNAQGTIDENKYIGFVARHVTLDIEDHARFLGILMLKKPPVKISDVKAALEVLLTSLANTYSNKLSDEEMKRQVSALSLSLLHDVIFPNQKRKATFRKESDLTKELEIEDLEKLIHENQMIEYAIHQVLCACCNIKSKHVPKACIPSEESFLSSLQLLFLNHHVALKYKNVWRPIFSTRTDGESFSKLAGVIINRGPTIIVVKDNEGNIFGGYNTKSWKIGPSFFGSSDSFLFHVGPEMNVYETTPFNQNFQYFNMKQKTMPNGLGQGGQLEYFGYWIDSEFGKVVTSPSCTTYYSPQLGVQEGKIVELEIWGLGDEPDDMEGGGASVLNMDPELQAVMEMMGKTFHSKAIREVDAKENETEEK